MTTISAIAAALFAAAPATSDDLRESLPVHEGRITLSGLEKPVTVQRDRLGVPDIHGGSFEDVVRAQGFVHAQERFFQMDAGRRLAAGELAELIGPAMLQMDLRYRAFRFRHIANEVMAKLDERDRELLRHYAEGVNAALDVMVAPGTAPPEYGLLNAQPSPWQPEDSILIVLAMYDLLHMEGQFEKSLGVMRDLMPLELYEFLTPSRSRFDAPLLADGEAPWEPSPIPGPEVIDLRGMSAADVPVDAVITAPLALGSNNWAVAGHRSTHGGAILANDPHLQLSAPGIWYHAQLRWPGHELVGLTLPGVPGLVAGSNGHIAWGFTNTMGDFQDFIIIEVDPDDPSRYRTPDGYEAFGEVVERINVRGRPAHPLRLRTTRWGIVTDEDHRGRPLVMKWTALDPGSVDLRITDMIDARTLEEAVEEARRWSGPSQNILIAHRDGGIAWVVSGYLPDRFGYDGRHPVSWAGGDKGWNGPIPENERPVLVNPESGVLYTANNRTVALERAVRLGGIWTGGERAARIAELLREQERFSEHDLLRIQLDTRVRLFDFYRDLAIEAMNLADGDTETLAQARAIIESWNGAADADQPAMRLLDSYRRLLHQMVIAPLLAACTSESPGFRYRWFMSEEPMRRILEERPAHLVPPGYASWEAVIERAWRFTLARLENELDRPWGEVNAANVAHPLTQAMPFLAPSLNMPAAPQSGHAFAVRVAGPSFGASARMVVSPGREARGILHTPAGQSGHPQSPHYRAGHEEWLRGEPLPIQPQEPEATLVLEP